MNVQKINYSSMAKTVVPKNIFKKGSSLVAKDICQMNLKPQHIVHPYYKPSKLDQFTLCSSEVYPSLLDGKCIVPAINYSASNLDDCIIDISLRFPSVKDISLWTMKYNDFLNGKNVSQLKDIESTISTRQVNKVTIDLNKYDALKIFVKELESDSGTLFTAKTFDSLVFQICNDKNSKVFLEDLYSFLLQNHIKTESHLVLIIESIQKHFNKGIDNLNVVEELLLQLFNIIETYHFNSSQLKETSLAFLKSIEREFHIKLTGIKSSASLKQEILKFYIQNRYLSESRGIFRNIISSGYYPNTIIINDYLNLVNETFTDSKLKKLIFTSDFAEILYHTNDPNIFKHFFDNCRDYNEFDKLLDILLNKNTKSAILDSISETIIFNAGNFEKSNIQNVINLSTLYNKLTKVFNDESLKKYLNQFIRILSTKGALPFISDIIENNKIVLSPDLVQQIISDLSLAKLRNNNQLNQTHYLLEFLQNYILPSLLNSQYGSSKSANLLFELLKKNHEMFSSTIFLKKYNNFYSSLSLLYNDLSVEAYNALPLGQKSLLIESILASSEAVDK